jgi:glycosyltransferase involved in cell wall biosynthesis
LETITKEGWSIKKEAKKVIPNIPSVPKVRPIGPTNARVTEIVFVGPLNIQGGLKVFSDALDIISEELGNAGIKVTFLGPLSTINEMASDEYLELRSQNWEANNLKWSIKVAEELNAIADYMTHGSAGKIGVVPSINDPSGSFAQTLLQSGVKFIGSSRSAIKEMVSTSSKDIIVSPEGQQIATKISSVLNGSCKCLKPTSSRLNYLLTVN